MSRLPPLQAWEGEEAPIHTGAYPVDRTLWYWVCPGTSPGAKREMVDLKKKGLEQKDRNIDHAVAP